MKTPNSETAARRLARELLVVAALLALTAAMTWPWVTRLRDAVGDEGDPYMIAWTLWWDYHQTFADPLNLFHANVFYPYKYTLAFSEHDYGIAVLFFPLFAAGLRPLTVHAVATFCGFAFSGYGAYRLARTLTGSEGVAWVSGIVFAFIPYRFHVLSHLHYLFAGWVPLVLESLVLFARAPTRRRAAWLGAAFTMNALTCISYFILTLVPLALSALFLVLRYRLERDRAFWLRGAAALGGAALALLPFMLPYYFVMKTYGFVRSADEIALNSPAPLHWLVAEGRNKLWSGFGGNIPGAAGHRLFPGLLPLLLSLPAFLWAGGAARRGDAPGVEGTGQNQKLVAPRRNLIAALDVAALTAAVVALLATGYQGSEARLWGVEVFKIVTPARALFAVALAVVARLSLAYPRAWRWAEGANLVESVRVARRGDAYALGLVWAACGFLGSLGMNFFLNRVLFDFVPLFRAIRIPTHWAMVAYVGLALLAGLGAKCLAERVARGRPASGGRRNLKKPLVFVAVAVALLFELRAAPLRFVRGKVYPDEITLRLRETPMRGGLVELPLSGEGLLMHRYMLRAADHMKPLVNATSSFISPATEQIQRMVGESPVDPRLLDLLEELPASYLVVHASSLPPERRADYETFLSQGILAGRLRYVRSYGDRDDLYAVVKTEPGARTEAPLPFAPAVREWGALLAEDPVYLLGQYQAWSQAVYRLHVASYGELPRYAEFLADVRAVSRGVTYGLGGQEPTLRDNLRELADRWVARARFKAAYQNTSDAQYVARLAANAGSPPDEQERAALADRLSRGELTRAGALLEIAGDPRFAERERHRSLVLLHFFGYLRRNPGDPPDNNMDGFDYWVRELDASGDRAGLSRAFMAAGEYKDRKRK